MYKAGLKGRFRIKDILNIYKYKIRFAKENPNYFYPFGTMIFCGSQGMGKTLSATQYVLKVREEYPYCVLVTNVGFKTYPFNAHMVKVENMPQPYVVVSDEDGCIVTEETVLSGQHKYVTVEYDGLDTLKFVNNGKQGVLFLIDELHLEMNSLESKNIDIEIMTEISQQRKQRKHIVGTSQVYMRLAKPLREQIHNVVLCKGYFDIVQYNKLIDGETAVEEHGKLQAEIIKRCIYTRNPEMFEEYDTFAKMKRYSDQWQGRARINIYHDERVIEVNTNDK